MLRKEVEVLIAGGIGTDQVARLVQLATSYESTIYLQNQGRKINAKSIMGVIGSGITQGMLVEIMAEGKDEEDAVSALEAFFSGQ